MPIHTHFLQAILIGLDLDLERSRQTPDVGYHVDERRRRTSADDFWSSWWKSLRQFLCQVCSTGELFGGTKILCMRLHLNLYWWLHLVRGSAWIRDEVGTATRPWTILNMVVGLWFFRRCPTVGHCSFSSITDTLLWCLWSPDTNLAALRFTLSTLSISSYTHKLTAIKSKLTGFIWTTLYYLERPGLALNAVVYSLSSMELHVF